MMRNLKVTRVGFVLALVVLISLTTVVLAQPGGGAMQIRASLESALRAGESPDSIEATYDLSWYTIDGGGTTSNGGSGYALGGTAGQPDAAVWSGGDYTLAGGLWGGAMVEHRIYLPLVLRG